MLLESAARFLRSSGGTVRWAEMGELGWIGAALSEGNGGFGGRAADVLPICEAIGASGIAIPYFSSALLPAGLLAETPPFQARSEVLRNIVSGLTRFSVAHTEKNLNFAAEAPLTAAREANGVRLSGEKHRVWDAAEADMLIVSAGNAGRFGWYLVNARDSGVHIQPAHVDRDMGWATVRFSDSPAVEICCDEDAHHALDRGTGLAMIGVLAESVGCMGALFDITREWLVTRRQFGRPLAENQVLQHRLVDMFIALEESRSMLNLAVHLYDHGRTSGWRAALHAAKAHIANSARFVGQQAVHLHGAMGLTEEGFVGRAYRRLEVLGAVFGGADFHTWSYVAGSGGA